MTAVDPFTVELVQNGLQAVCDEMFTALRRAAMSMVIYERLDFGVAVTDRHGRMICQGAGLPGFIGMLDGGVKAAIAKFATTGAVAPGDIFISNDPFAGGGSHLNDVVLTKPVFGDGGGILGWVVNKAHWSDIGGVTPGSMSTEAREIYQEGLLFPDVKLFEGGRPVQGLIDMIRGNSRMPDSTLGDMWAGIAALRAGEQRLQALGRKFGPAGLERAVEAFLADGEAESRRALRGLPRGRFEASDRMEDGRPLRAMVEITEDAFVVDLRGNPAQDESPFNCPRVCTWSAAQIVFKAVTSGSSLANEGSFRPLTLLTDPGSVFDARRPAAVSFYFEPLLYALDLIWKALAPQVPDLTGAGQINSVSAVTIGGIHRDTGRFVLAVETQLGGWGARPGCDGQNGLYSAASGESFNSPVEIYERRNGIQVDSYGFHGEDGGAGEFRGGRGICKAFRVIGDGAWLTSSHIRSAVPPWGLAGGRPGSSNYVVVTRTDGSETLHRRVTKLPMNPGDVVRVYTACGGGYGDPRRRSRALVLDDLKNGYVTLDQAARHYGVTRGEAAAE